MALWTDISPFIKAIAVCIGLLTTDLGLVQIFRLQTVCLKRHIQLHKGMKSIYIFNLHFVACIVDSLRQSDAYMRL